jgi:primary-amine oxidase
MARHTHEWTRVIFFNLGMHHVPHSGDIPNTLMHTSSSSVMFTPFNFHNRDPSRLNSQGVQLDVEAKGTKPRYFGQTYHEGVKLKKVGDSSPPPRLWAI